MANTLVNPTWVAFEVATGFSNSLKAVTLFDRQYSDEYVVKGAKVGNTVKIRLPQQYEASEGEALVQQNLLDQTVDVILNRRRHVGFGWSSSEATLNLDDVRTRYVQPAAEVLANVYDRQSQADVVLDVWNTIGTLGTTPSAALTYLQAKVKLLDQATPDDGNINAALDPLATATISNATDAMFHPRGELVENWMTGQFADSQLGISKWVQDQNIHRLLSGEATGASTPLVNGAGQSGSSLITDGWGSGVSNLNKGDSVTLAGVYSVNPQSKESTGRLQQFVITADISDTTGDLTMAISPSIITSGALQNVTATPADNAVLTFWSMTAGGTQTGTVSPQNLVFHRGSFASVMADLVMPSGGAKAGRVSSKDIGIALRYVEQYAITSDQNLNRLDILFGSATVQARMACRVVG